jgi:hypothetical protein
VQFVKVVAEQETALRDILEYLTPREIAPPIALESAVVAAQDRKAEPSISADDAKRHRAPPNALWCCEMLEVATKRDQETEADAKFSHRAPPTELNVGLEAWSGWRSAALLFSTVQSDIVRTPRFMDTVPPAAQKPTAEHPTNIEETAMIDDSVVAMPPPYAKPASLAAEHPSTMLSISVMWLFSTLKAPQAV